MDKTNVLQGGEFLVKDVDAQDVFIPEEFDEEQQMIAQTCEDFLETEVFPVLDRIDQQEEGLMRELIGKAGELGLLGISVPEEYEGFGQSFVTSMLPQRLWVPDIRSRLPIRHIPESVRCLLFITEMKNKNKDICQSWQRVNGRQHTVLQSLTPARMPIQVKQMPCFRKTVNTISSTGKKCGLPTAALPTC